jgi:YjbE family integral membrane protein
VEFLTTAWPNLLAFFSVVAIDIALAGDNALVIGMAAAGLAPAQRRRAILLGITAAASLRIVFALFTVRLLQVVGLTMAGGILLLWVAWKLWREIRAQRPVASVDDPAAAPAGKTLRQAATQIVAADISMSLDNVLAVAGAARDHFWVLTLGLGLSVALTGLAAGLLARMIHRFRWIAYLGLAVVLGVAVSMIHDGALKVAEQLPQP